jgi:hypothetical protein
VPVTELASAASSGTVPTGVDAPGYSGLKRWPLSSAQELLWFLGGRWPKADLPHRLTVSMSETFTGPIDPEALHRAVRDLVGRHEVLRSAVVVQDGRPWVVVCPSAELPMPRHDLRDLPPGDRESRAEQLMAEFVNAPVSVFEAPAVRLVLIAVAEDDHRLGVCAHHLFFDYWSARLFKGELLATYAALRDGRPPPLTAAEIQYVDFASWERDLAEAPGGAGDVGYWVDKLADLQPLRVPTDRPRPWFVTGAARRASVVIPGALRTRLAALAAQHRATPFIVLVGVFLCLLARETGRPDVAIPTIFSGRIRPETWSLMGYFDNILFLRYEVDDSLTVAAMVDQVRDTVLEAYQHHEVPMLRVIEQQPRLLLLLANALNIWTLFHLEVDPFRLRPSTGGLPGEDAPAADPLGDVDVELADGVGVDDEDTYSFGADLDVTLRETPDALHLRTLYSKDLFDPETVTSLLQRYAAALAVAVDDPSTRVRDLFVDAADRSR